MFCNSAVGFQICILYALNVGLALDTPMDFKRLPVATFLSYAYLGAIGEDNFFLEFWSHDMTVGGYLYCTIE